MELKMEIAMKDGTIKHENVKVKNHIEAHKKMHKKYKGQYNTTLIISE
ncbi:hypothetical protein [Oceanobacillus kimchii]|uniref:Uncharacterized protein n=1 Tax=Oceanobacillus kimchii TaxID=746691 RepID=A0ABQ5TKR0_9BACI|nr:hypothetical protein [Oceanobacillus kimchii]GLO66169.1 hypothetical protein MACH08_19530 [Oceanobacillus kimchii]